MTTELFYLVLSALLASVLWVPSVVGYVTTRGFLRPHDYKVAPTSPLPDWVNRAVRAHANMVENLSAFAALVLVAHVTGVSTPLTALAAAVFFWARLAHAVVHLSGFSRFMARTVIFGIGNAATILLGLAILLA